MTARISLQKFDDADWPIIWKWIEGYYWKVADDYAPKTMQAFVDSQRVRGSKNLGVYKGSELVGLIMFDHLSPVLCECHIYFKRSFWGHENTLPALQLAYDWALNKTNYEKCTVPVFESNRLIIQVLRKFGAVQEGFFRNHTHQRGKPVNVLMFSMFRGN